MKTCQSISYITFLLFIMPFISSIMQQKSSKSLLAENSNEEIKNIKDNPAISKSSIEIKNIINNKSKKEISNKKSSKEDQVNAFLQIKNKITSSIKNLIQKVSPKTKDKEDNEDNEDKDKGENRLTRFIWSLILVLVFTIGLFFLVKYSIDWATRSKNELNKLGEQKFREISTVLISKDFLKDENDEEIIYNKTVTLQ